VSDCQTLYAVVNTTVTVVTLVRAVTLPLAWANFSCPVPRPGVDWPVCISGSTKCHKSH